MKSYAVLVLLLLVGCSNPESSFERLYFATYYWRVTDIPKPDVRVISYVEYTHDLKALKANRQLPGSDFKFYQIDLFSSFADSLNRLADTTHRDISYQREVFPPMVDENSYAIVIVKPGKILMIGFLRHTLPSNLTPFFQILRRHSGDEKTEISLADTTMFGKLESMILANPQLPQPPPVKTLKFIAPKIATRVKGENEQLTSDSSDTIKFESLLEPPPLRVVKVRTDSSRIMTRYDKGLNFVREFNELDSFEVVYLKDFSFETQKIRRSGIFVGGYEKGIWHYYDSTGAVTSTKDFGPWDKKMHVRHHKP
jgi:hypothetical protein